MKYSTFVFRNYEFDPSAKTLRMYYGYDDALTFTETFKFDFDFVEYDHEALHHALQQLFFLAGVSYYKMFLAPDIRVDAGEIDTELQGFLNKVYQRGLGEFWYVNSLSPNTPVSFPVNRDSIPQFHLNSSGLIVGVGGGKDSLVSIELLRDSGQDIATWSLNHRSQLTPLVERIGLKHYFVEREWDPQMVQLNERGAYNGHVPISAIIAATGTVVAILTGRRDHVVSNEQSANEPTLKYEGIDINHQWSKSGEFEQMYQNLLEHTFGEGVRYYSLLRSLSELRIAELFATQGWFKKYADVFSSCNRAFVHSSDHMSWCGQCPKCAFVYLALTPFLPAAQVQDLFGGRNLLLNPELEIIYRQLLGIDSNKPLECVGEVKESRAAMREARKTHVELRRYIFDIPNSYNFRALSPNHMPPEIYELIEPKIRQ